MPHCKYTRKKREHPHSMPLSLFVEERDTERDAEVEKRAASLQNERRRERSAILLQRAVRRSLLTQGGFVLI